ncbi:MAG: ArsC/Spx/MgsR family protein [Saprospiraceae bacterium]
MEIWHNPRCGKSRAALEMAKSQESDLEVRLYLQNPPKIEELKALLKKLKISAIELVRTKEPEWESVGYDANWTEDQILDALIRYPILIERPILISGKKAIIGRTEEALAGFFHKDGSGK